MISFSSTTAVTPTLGARGTYTSAAPFNTLLNASIEYTCVEVALLRSLASQDIDGFEDVYSPANLTQSKFDADCLAGVCLVYLQSGTGEIVKIPSNYLTGVPDPNGVRYSAMMAGLYLGALPDTFDGTDMLTALAAVAKTYTGIDAQAKMINLAPEYLVRPELHDTIQKSRTTTLAASETIISQNERLLEANAALQKQVDDLLAALAAAIA